MRDADGLDDGQDDRTLNMVASTILAMRLGGADMKFGDMTGARSQGKAEARKEGEAAC